MVDTNRPARWRVIDTQEPRSIVATYNGLHEANALCLELEPTPQGENGFRFVCEPVRETDMIA